MTRKELQAVERTLYVIIVIFAVLLLSLIIALACWADNHMLTVIVWIAATLLGVIIIVIGMILTGLVAARSEDIQKDEQLSEQVNQELEKARNVGKK